MDPTEVLPYFQLLGQIALVVGALFAGYQLVLLRRSRDEQADLQTLTAFNSVEFRQAFASVNSLPLKVTADDIREKGVEEAATTVLMTFEMLGVLVYNHRLSLKTLEEAIGGFMRESWRRLQPYVAAKRAEINSPRFAEWYQWLYEHLPVDRRRERGAYEVFRDW